MIPKRKTTALKVRLALQRVKVRRYRERNRDKLLADRRERHPEVWARDRERILARRKTPEARDRARVYDVKRRHSGVITLRLLISGARRRAKAKGVDFTITAADVRMPETCPLLEIPLFVNIQQGAGPNSPTLDRKDNSKGYIPGNVWVISYKANTAKSNLTPDELLLLATRLKEFLA